jgi:BirA family biotin operon repressor/biotin-[acetyl-CoA-carboxylase] ligase
MNQNVISIRAADDSIVKLECHQKLLSAAMLAKQYAKMGYPDRYVVIAESEQQKGAERKGLFMSCIFRPSFFPSQASLLSALSTVALHNALKEHTTKRIGIGWVSNLYCEGKAIGGVTIEGKLDNFTSYEYIIVNFAVTLSPENFPPRLTDLVRKVFESENSSIAMIIAKNVINKFLPLYSQMRTNTKFMNQYTQSFILHGKKIKYTQKGKKVNCKVLGINSDDGALIVEMKNGEIKHITSPTGVIIPKKVKLSKSSKALKKKKGEA